MHVSSTVGHHFFAERCVTAVLRDTSASPRGTVTRPCHRGSTGAPRRLHICTCLTHRSASLSPSAYHLCLPPTSPLPHQDHPNISPRCFLKLPWVKRPHAQITLPCRGGRWGVSQMRGNPICTVFIGGYFSCRDSHHQSAVGPKQRVWGALTVDAGSGS